MPTQTDLATRFGTTIPEHLEAEAEVPVLTSPQPQGDVMVVPIAHAPSEGALVPPEGIALVRGEAGGNTHRLLAEGDVRFTHLVGDQGGLILGILSVGEGATAWLDHPQHGYTGIGTGTYEVRRQRQQAEIQRLVAD